MQRHTTEESTIEALRQVEQSLAETREWLEGLQGQRLKADYAQRLRQRLAGVRDLAEDAWLNTYSPI